MIKNLTNRDESVNEFNLLKIRQSIKNQYERKYKVSLEKEIKGFVKKNMLSRDPLSTTPNLYRALTNEQKSNILVRYK